MMLAAACTGADGAVATVASTPDGSGAVADSSPLEAVVGFSSDTSRRNQQLLTMQRRANETVVACMADAGFRYTPESVSPSFLLGPRTGDGSRGWVQVNGMGIATSLLDLSRPESAPVDAAARNGAYVATLDPASSAAYDRALIGDAGATAGVFAPDGCWGQAYGVTVRRLAVLDEFAPRLETLDGRVQADPRMRALTETWSACMAGAGHDYDDRTELIDDLFARLLRIDYVQNGPLIEFVDPSAIDQLLAHEIDVAVDDFDCRQAIAADVRAIRDDYEREFLNDHRHRLEQLLQSSP